MPTIGGRDGSRFQGLARALINGMVKGAATGYTKTLQLVGTGYRAEVKGQILNLSLGFSHPVLPDSARSHGADPRRQQGHDHHPQRPRQGDDRPDRGEDPRFRPPEPYGGKGVRYHGEKVREKAGKAGKGAAGGGK